jgi:hypothetical protein
MSETITEKNVTADLLKAHIEFQVNNAIDKIDLSYPEHIKTWDEKQKFIEMQRNMLKNNLTSKLTAKTNESGKTAYFLNNEIQINPQTAELLSVEEIFKQHYKNHIQPPKGFVPEKAATAGESFLKTKTDVMNFLAKKFHPQGIKLGHPKWNAEYERICRQQQLN